MNTTVLHVFNFKCLMFQIEHRQRVERVFAFNICCIALNASLCSSLEHVLAFKMCSIKNICVQVLHTWSVQYYRTRPRRSISVALLVFKLCSIPEHMFLNTCKRSVPGVQTVFFSINTKVFNITEHVQSVQYLLQFWRSDGVLNLNIHFYSVCLLRRHETRTAITNTRMLPFCADTELQMPVCYIFCAGTNLITSLMFGSWEPNNHQVEIRLVEK